MSNRRRLRRPDPNRGRIMPTTRDSEGHNTVILEGPQGPAVERVCVLVAAAFIGPCPPGQRVQHVNGDPSDDRAENLRYVPHERA